MALNASTAAGSSGATFTNMEPGTYPARVVMVVDLGVQGQPPFQGKDKPPVQMVSLTYEFVDEFLLDEDGEAMEDKPRWLSEQFPLFNLASERAKSTARYRALDPANTHGGDFTKLLDTACNVTVINNPGSGPNKGKVFDNIAEVTTMRAKDASKCPELVNPAVVFDLDAPDKDVFLKLPKFIQEKIKNNLNFQGSKLEELLAGSTEKAAAKPKPSRNKAC